MRFSEKLSKDSPREIWQEYCGFLDLSMEEYMQIQKSLLIEQIKLLSGSKLGRRLLKNTIPQSVDEFRRTVPLTRFEDYADTLLLKREDDLPAKPVVWLETTWEGGEFPRKCAPYSKSMLDTYTRNMLSIIVLSGATRREHYRVRENGKILYTLAPMPYPTGLFPHLAKGEIDFRFMPPVKEAVSLSFSKQMAKGFEMAVKKGMHQFFGMSSILYYISENLLNSSSGSGFSLKKLAGMSPVMLYRFMKARYRCRRDKVPMLPRDIFKLDAFVCVGNDSTLYKNDLEKFWGKRPMEIAGGTEPTLIGTETWSHNGLVLFPDVCFYEFIPEKEMQRSLDDPSYIPRTYLMDELSPNQLYELVITVLKGGIFTRYRVGDVYRCLRLHNPADGLSIPQFEFIDRTPNVIDIGGFTRITAREIEKVISLSRLPIRHWSALKEYDSEKHAFLQMFIELDEEGDSQIAAADIVKQHLSLYFQYYDDDYIDLKKLINMDPLRVNVVPKGSFSAFENARGHKIRSINPPTSDVVDFRSICGLNRNGGVNAWQ